MEFCIRFTFISLIITGLQLVLSEIIIRAISGDSVCEQRLIKLCADFAESYLRMRAKKDAYLFKLISVSTKDLALDCIAELFEKREGKLIVFKDYFEGEISKLEKQSEYQTSLRRLVFSKVNENLYNYYKSFDPSLGKIIRNIKRVFKEDVLLDLVYDTKSGYISYKKQRVALALMPYDLIEIKLNQKFKTTLSTKDILIELAKIFKRHEFYRAEIKINLFAEIIRSLHQFYAEDNEHFNFSEHEDIRNNELKELIKRSIKRVQLDLHSSYVAKQKLSSEDFSKYFLVAEKVLNGDYVKGVENGKSYFDHYLEIDNNISKEEYRDNHRKYVEYFVKISRFNFIESLKKEE